SSCPRGWIVWRRRRSRIRRRGGTRSIFGMFSQDSLPESVPDAIVLLLCQLTPLEQRPKVRELPLVLRGRRLLPFPPAIGKINRQGAYQQSANERQYAPEDRHPHGSVLMMFRAKVLATSKASLLLFR